MRLSVLNVILIVTLVFGAAIGSAFLIYKTFTSDDEVVGAAAERTSPTLSDTLGPTVELAPFTVNLAGGNRYLRSEIVLELTERQSAEEIGERLPQVRDSILSVLRRFSADQLSSPDADGQVKDEIRAALNPLLSKGRVSGVYFTSWVIQ